ncbi:MAG: TolC family protein [Acidobacteria bacterium]|nr:TolC family protein [Acidobacteriota bacterium]
MIAGMMMVVALASTAWAQQATVSLSLDDAIARGRVAAPRIAEAQARREAADATVAARSALRRPVVSASGAYQRTNHVDEYGIPQANGTTKILFPDIPNNFRGRADASMPIFTSGRLESLIAAATLDLKATDADLRTASADVSLDVARAYWTLVTARETARVVEQGLVRMTAYTADVKSRMDAGFLPPNDLLSAQAQRARQSVALIQAKNTAAVAQADLARLVGLDLDATIVTTTPLETPMASAASLTTMSMAALTEQARGGRSERDALTERADAAREAGTAASAALRPQVGIAAGFEESRPNARIVPRVDEWRHSWEAGISVTWQLFDGGKAKADRAAAAAQATALERRRDDFDAMLGLELRQRRLDVESGRAALEATAEAIAAATEARRVVEERFRAGVATSTDVLDAQTALLEAELERTRIAATLRLNEARLLRAAGGQ